MKTLNIFLDLDINKCGYAIFVNSILKDSGVLKTDKQKKLFEKPTQQTKTNKPENKYKMGKDNIPVGEWRKDPRTGKYTYWSLKLMNIKFGNDIDRAEHMTSKLIDMVALKDYGEINKIRLFIEDSNSNHRKLEYIGMVKTYLWEALEYKWKGEKEIAKLTLDEINNINVSSIKKQLKIAYATLVRKKEINVDMEQLIQRDTKYLSEQIVKLVFEKEIENDEADAINMMFIVDNLWYLKNIK